MNPLPSTDPRIEDGGRTRGTPVEPVAELLFGASDGTPMSTDPNTVLPWAQAREQLTAAAKYWLATGRPDGRPHVMPVLAVWLVDALYVATRPTSCKGRNLIGNPRCVLTASTESTDLVVECHAVEVRDVPGLTRVADAFAAKYEWRFTVGNGAARDESLPGAPTYAFYRLQPTRGFGYGADGLTATRWRFGP